jgi:hypothetical protein
MHEIAMMTMWLERQKKGKSERKNKKYERETAGKKETKKERERD